MARWRNLLILLIALTLHTQAGADTERALQETISQINKTLSEAQCERAFPDTDVTEYTFSTKPASHTVTFTGTHTEKKNGRSSQRIERIEISIHRLRLGAAVLRPPDPVIGEEFFLSLDCLDFSYCVSVVETRGRNIVDTRSVRGKNLPLCHLNNQGTTRLIERIRRAIGLTLELALRQR